MESQKKIDWKQICLLFVMFVSIKAISQPTDPFTVYNNSQCPILVAIEYWDDICTPGSPCYQSPVGGDYIGPMNSFSLPTCSPQPGDVHVVILQIDGVSMSGTGQLDVGFMGSNCINSNSTATSGAYPSTSSCGSAAGWTLQYNNPSDVTFQ